ncbi:MAG TPA: DNA replication and repair protein RecF [Methylomirabilota bacterium]|nr:DNA replication and repair protein RecF [Methylomirabilota bacterium]
MHLEEVEFADFRSYRTLSFAPAASLNVLTGPNAQGKTNLLEGLGFLLVGRSFRGAKPADLPRWESAGAVTVGGLRRQDTVRRLRRAVAQREDGAWVATGEGCPWARVIPFGWQDLAILTGGPQARRQFVDGFAGKLYPAHLTAHARYRQVLARRNHVLQSGLDRTTLRARLGPWSEQLAQLGLELLVRRRAAVRALESEVQRLYRELAGEGQARLEYRASIPEGAAVADVVEALAAGVEQEVRRGQTLLGPHRDDLLIEVDGRDLRAYGSRGRQRLMALVLRLAEVGPVARAVGSRPVLLLDDALSELDPGAQARVLERIAGAGQVFLTTADAVLPEAAAAAWWEVKGGRVTEATPMAVRGIA